MVERLTRAPGEEHVELCERCGKVCDGACRARTSFDLRRMERLLHGRVA